MALRAFLIAHKLPQYEECFLGAGFDDVAAFATYDGEDVNTMEQTLHAAGVLPGHVDKIMRTVRDCQDKEVRRKPGESPLQFNYGKQMPLLEILRDEVRTLKQGGGAHAAQLGGGARAHHARRAWQVEGEL